MNEIKSVWKWSLRLLQIGSIDLQMLNPLVYINDFFYTHWKFNVFIVFISFRLLLLLILSHHLKTFIHLYLYPNLFDSQWFAASNIWMSPLYSYFPFHLFTWAMKRLIGVPSLNNVFLFTLALHIFCVHFISSHPRFALFLL